MGLILRSLWLTGLLIVLIAFPSELFNSTVQSNYDEIIKWAWLHKLHAFSKNLKNIHPVLALLGFGLLGAFINSLLSPDFGFNKATLSLILGMFIAVVLGSLIYDLVRSFYLKRKFGIKSRLRAHSFGLLTGSILVLTSRLANFLPGYCYGLFTGLIYERDPDDRQDGQGLAISAAMLIIVALIGWFAWVPIKGMATSKNPNFFILVIDAAMASLWVSTLTSTVFGLAPLRFMYGEQVKKWNNWGWGAIYSTGVFLFVYTLLNPAIGIYGKSDKVSWVAVLALFAAFGLFSLGFWGYFRYRHLFGWKPKK